MWEAGLSGSADQPPGSWEPPPLGAPGNLLREASLCSAWGPGGHSVNSSLFFPGAWRPSAYGASPISESELWGRRSSQTAGPRGEPSPCDPAWSVGRSGSDAGGRGRRLGQVCCPPPGRGRRTPQRPGSSVLQLCGPEVVPGPRGPAETLRCGVVAVLPLCAGKRGGPGLSVLPWHASSPSIVWDSVAGPSASALASLPGSQLGNFRSGSKWQASFLPPLLTPCGIYCTHFPSRQSPLSLELPGTRCSSGLLLSGGHSHHACELEVAGLHLGLRCPLWGPGALCPSVGSASG